MPLPLGSLQSTGEVEVQAITEQGTIAVTDIGTQVWWDPEGRRDSLCLGESGTTVQRKVVFEPRLNDE